MNRTKNRARTTKRVTSSVRQSTSKTLSKTSSMSSLTSMASRSMSTTQHVSSQSFSRAVSSASSNSLKGRASAVVSKRALTTSASSSVLPSFETTQSTPVRRFAAPRVADVSNVSAPVVNAPSASIHTAATKKAVAPVSMMMKQPSAAPAAVAPAVPVVMAPNRGFMTPAFFYNMHTNHMKKWLTARGLYIEDTYYNNEICKLAVNELPADVRNDRLRRLKRAIDLDLKMKTLPADLQNYDPFVSYGLDDTMGRIEAVIAERYNYI